MSEQEEATEEPKGEEPQGEAPNPFRVEVRNGQYMDLEAEKAHDLIRKGIGFEKKMKGLKDREASLEGKEAATSVGEQLLDLKRRHPDRVARMLAIADGEEVTPRASNGTADSNIDPEQLTEAERALFNRNQALEKRLEEVLGTVKTVSGNLSAQQERENRKRLEEEIRSEAKTVKNWDEPDVEYFMPQIERLIAAEDLTPLEAVQQVASMDAARAKRKAEAAVARQRNNAPLQTIRAREGTPSTATVKKHTAQDLKDGSLLKNLFAEADRIFGH